MIKKIVRIQLVGWLIPSLVFGGKLTVMDVSDQSAYALKQMENLFAHNMSLPNVELELSVDKALKSESYRYSVVRGSAGLKVNIVGGDPDGVLYGCQTLKEQLLAGGDAVVDTAETARFPFRALKFNLPYMSYRSGDALSLHEKTCRDLKFWEAFLDMMVEARFNSLTLWSLHPFHLMIRNEKYPEACDLSDQQLVEWHSFWSSLFSMAKERGIETYMVNWNIFVSPAFAEHHNVARYSIQDKRTFIGKGDTSELVKDYTRTTITQVLNTYPDLTGIGISLGERMGEMSPEEREQWILDTVVAGIKAANRPARFIHRLPFSADKKSGGSSSLSTELMTRNAIESLDLPGPILTEVKFNWSHGHSTPTLVHVHGGKIGDTYWNPMPKNYQICWMVRNEDFFSLRWCEPDFIREHIRMNGQSYVGGYYVGSECYIPAKDYLSTPEYQTRYAFDRQWLFYQSWGRLLYNPTLTDDTFITACRARYGDAGEPFFKALKLASRMPLRLASFCNSGWDFTLYSEGFISTQIKSNDKKMIEVDDLITRNVLDPVYLNIKQFVDMTLTSDGVPSGRISPLQLADEMIQTGTAALAELVRISPDQLAQNKQLFAEVADVTAWAHLSHYFGHKLQTATALYHYRKTKDPEQASIVLQQSSAMLADWKAVVNATKATHAIVPIAQMQDLDDLSNDTRRFHWSLLQPAVDAEVQKIKDEIKKSKPVTKTVKYSSLYDPKEI